MRWARRCFILFLVFAFTIESKLDFFYYWLRFFSPLSEKCGRMGGEENGNFQRKKVHLIQGRNWINLFWDVNKSWSRDLFFFSGNKRFIVSTIWLRDDWIKAWIDWLFAKVRDNEEKYSKWAISLQEILVSLLSVIRVVSYFGENTKKNEKYSTSYKILIETNDITRNERSVSDY